jgi:phosphodiesterase/alkaline phosphatase D-like protein
LQKRWIKCAHGFAIAVVATSLASAQTAPPDLKIVDGPNIESLTDTRAQIAWSTDVEASALVRYGTTQDKLDQTAREKWGGYKTQRSAVHRVALQSLKPNTTYYYQVESGEGWHKANNVAQSEVRSFTTRSKGATSAAAVPASQFTEPNANATIIQPGNILAGPIAADLTDRTATIWWMTRDASVGQLRFGTDPSQLDEGKGVPSGEVKKVPLDNLKPDTTYHFQVLDPTDRPIASGSFKTEAKLEGPSQFRITRGPIIETVGKDSVVIGWSTTARSSTTVRYGANPDQLDQTAEAPWGQERHRVTVRGLKPDTRYYFQVESAQAEGSGLSTKSNVAPFRTVAEGQTAMRNPEWQ